MSSKEMSIEKMYQKKSQLEHILLRPDTYIGSVEVLKEEMWIWDQENEQMMKKEISFVPGLYKIFDEILVNAADNKQRDKNMSLIRVNIDKENNTIRIFNNGRGIPVVEHKEEKLLVPTMIFGHLLTSSNYNDDEKKVTGGRNGYGAKLCNIFSKKFVLETSSKEFKKSFKQVWTNNMQKAEEPILKDAKEDDFTCITFVPDLSKFKMDRLDDDTIGLLARRAYDIAASTPGIKVYLNDKVLPIKKFEDYCKLYLNNETDEFNNPTKLVYERFSDRWEIAIGCSDTGFQQVSFVNSISTSKGGRHVDYIVDQVVKHLGELINKKNKNGNQVKPFQIKSHMWLFINCLIENPTFDSQTKENMTLQAKNFGSKCQLSDDYYKKLTKSGLMDRIMTWLAFKEKTDLEKAGSKSKVTKIRGIPKLDDANDAGTKDSINCTLIVTEGDSAKTLAVSGLGVIGRDKYGVFPLRGKMLNVREATTKQIIENAEVSNLLKIIGLNFKEKYESRDSLKQLRYGKLMIMTDQDHDGSHIKGLIINFVHNQWPNLLKHGFVEEFITPIVKVSKGSQEKSFYSMPEFEEWQSNTDNWITWKIKYYKGLGTSTSKEAKEYFSDMQRHRIKFGHSSARDDLAIQLAFSKKFIEERKDWLTRYMEERKAHREGRNINNYLYQKNTKEITFKDFINKELVLFSNLDNERSIPSLVDGFKPGQRKVLFSCFKRNLVKELKVAQLAGSVAEISAYHHGEQSLMTTIINLAQNYVGSNNINLLMPIGQFGTRLHGGKDAASPRYIFTCLSPLARLLFNPKDDPLYNYLNDDGLKVEPEYYCPIIPTVLVNGAEGIGTGWSTKVPNYNPREIIENIKLMINGREPRQMVPFYKNFRGEIKQIDEIRAVTNGELAVIGENTVEISELPIGVWTQVYKENVLEPYLHGADQKQPVISDYKEYHTDTTVRFVVKMTSEQFSSANGQGLHKFFKIQKSVSLNSMVLFGHDGCLRRYDSVNQILREFFDVRFDLYKKRKEYLVGMLGAESLKLDNTARFIIEKIEGKIRVENLKKSEICRILKERKYDPDPVIAWKIKISRDQGFEGDEVATETEEEENSSQKSTKDYDYLLGMPIWNLTMEKKDDILKQQKAKGDELAKLKSKTPSQLWLDDLDQFLIELDKQEEKEREDEVNTIQKTMKTKSGSAALKKNAVVKAAKTEYLPSKDGKRVEVIIDPVLLAKTEKEAKSKEKVKKEDKKEMNIVDLINSEEFREEEVVEFIKNLGKPVKREPKETKEPKEPKELKEPKEPKEPKESKDPKEPKQPKESKEPKAKRGKDKEKNTLNNYFKKKSDSTEESADEVSIVDSPVEKRTVSNRSTKNKVYVESGSDDEDVSGRKKAAKKESDDEVVLDSEEDDLVVKPKSRKVDKKDSGQKEKVIQKRKVESDDEDTENVPPKTKKCEAKKLLKVNEPKKKSNKNTDDDFVVSESDEDDFKPKSKLAKKKLLDKDDDYDIFKKSKITGTRKKAKNAIASDDDLFEIDS